MKRGFGVYVINYVMVMFVYGSRLSVYK